YMLEPLVSRLHGHSSSSGAHRVKNEPDCIDLLEHRLMEAHILDADAVERMHKDIEDEVDAAAAEVRGERDPDPEDVNVHTYAPSEVDAVYPGDYTGLPSEPRA